MSTLSFPIYMDNQATTRVDPRVVAAMLPFWESDYGNAGSLLHVFGEQAREAVEQARCELAAAIGAQPEEVIFTSGATESNNLAIRGVALHPRNQRRHLLSVATEHHATLDPLLRLERQGFEVELLPVLQAESPEAGRIDLTQAEQALSEQTALATVMLANNEIGAIQPIAELSEKVHGCGALLHCDATQAVGKMAVDVRQLGVDMMSFTAHKMYGPKGVGALYVRGGRPTIKLLPQIEGGGQEKGIRSGTLNVPGVVGFAKAMTLSLEELPTERPRLIHLRNELWKGLKAALPELLLNGPDVTQDEWRLPGNLNACFPGIDGQTLQLKVPELAISSGAACASSRPDPSHVLQAIGRSDDEVRSSLRFGLGRFNTLEEVQYVVEQVPRVVRELKQML